MSDMAVEHVAAQVEGDDWRKKENASFTTSVACVENDVARWATAKYAFERLLPPEIKEAHEAGRIHWHDASLRPYCYGIQTQSLLLTGFADSEPPRHFRSAIDQLINYLCCLSQEWAGAIAVPAFDTYYAPLVRADGLSRDEVRRAVESLVYSVNLAHRSGSLPFSNLDLSNSFPDHLRDQPAIVGGEMLDSTLGEYEKERAMIAESVMEVLLEGRPDGKPFVYPIVSIQVTDDFDWDTRFAQLACELAAKTGQPNWINCTSMSDYDPSQAFASCCRLSYDVDKVREVQAKKRKMSGGLFDMGLQTGAVGVCTINLAMLGAKHPGHWSGLIEELRELLDLAVKGLDARRAYVTRFLEEGLYPYTAEHLDSFDTFFSVIAPLGCNEMVQNFTGGREDMTTPAGQEWARRILQEMLDVCDRQEHLYGVEAAPCEGATYRLGRLTKKAFPDSYVNGTEDRPYLTNSTQLRPQDGVSIPYILENQAELQALYSSGTACHVYLDGESHPNVVRLIVRGALTTTPIPHLTVNPKFSSCERCGRINGHPEVCPKCGGPVENWLRILGYLAPMSRWNPGKLQEAADRVYL